MELLFFFMGFLTVLNCLTGVKGGVCPGYNIPVIWPCSDGTISGTKLLVDTSDIPIDMLQCNCKITTTTDEIQINLIKSPEYRNCGTEITFSTALSSKFGCFGGGTIVNTSAIKSVDVLVEKDNTIADVKHCFYIEVSSTPADFIANMSITCSSHRSTEAPTTNVITSTVSFPSTSSTVLSTSSPATTTTPTRSTVTSTSSPARTATPTRSTVTSMSSSARTATPSTVMTSKTPSVSTTQIPTSSTIPTSTFYSQSTPSTNSKFTKTSTETTLISTLKSTHTNKPTVVTSRQPTATMTDTPLVTTDKLTEMTTEQGGITTNSEEVTAATLSMSNTNSGKTEIVDSTVFSKTDSDATNGSEKSPNTQQSTTTYSGTTPNNATLTDDDIGANPERLTVVIVIATIIGIILICVLIGAIYYQKKQKRKVFLKQRMAFTNMASTIVDEERASKEDSKNHVYDNPNLIPYGHMEST